MKKNLLGLITCLSILISTSCTQTLPGGSNTGGGVSPLTSWSCEIDGVPYSWSGSYPVSGTDDGQSIFSIESNSSVTTGWSNMSNKVNSNGIRTFMLSYFIKNPTAATTYNLNPSNYNNQNSNAALFLFGANSVDSYLSAVGNSSFTVNIDTLSNNSATAVGFAGAGLVTGTFSGKLYKSVSSYVNITNGKFRSIRAL
jgi:hypothetical protein